MNSLIQSQRHNPEESLAPEMRMAYAIYFIPVDKITFLAEAASLARGETNLSWAATSLIISFSWLRMACLCVLAISLLTLLKFHVPKTVEQKGNILCAKLSASPSWPCSSIFTKHWLAVPQEHIENLRNIGVAPYRHTLTENTSMTWVLIAFPRITGWLKRLSLDFKTWRYVPAYGDI